MKNFIQPGDNITLSAPADVLSGDGVLIDSLFGVASGDAESGSPVVLSTVGVFELPKKTADAITIGAAVYWDDSESELTLTATDNTKVGVAVTANDGAGTVQTRLNGSF